ncbi:efflux RND transporter periplasmic adaptor subunit [Candidatus Methylocalor cossyra]|uniref:Efflux transporter, RND family, MFP subunit n=1 Tax=Candidatus Methylocalor cossyra TaxID=3108543 RepID=A0ABM9NII6_9GAMM
MNRAQRRGRRWLIYGFAAALLALLAQGFRPAPQLVDTELVSLGPLAVTVEEEGRTRVIDRYVVSAPLAAQARRITLNVGDRVEAGQTLVVLDALPSPISDLRSVAEARARVAAAEAALATAREEAQAAEAAAHIAEDAYQRLRQLRDRNLAALATVDQAEAEARRTAALHRSAQFRVHTARSELEAARAALAYAGRTDPKATGTITLRAPVAGEVLVRHFESERVVQAGEPILEIGDLSALEVEVDVLSSDAVRLAPGMRVLFERWGSAEPLEGRVKRVEPRAFTKVSALGVEEQRVFVIADLVSPRERWARLGDGYRVEARFILWEAAEALRVPTASLFRHGQGWAAFVVQDGRARLRPVAIGRRAALHSEVLAGLTAGERVVVHPGRELADGSRVRLREPP